MHERQKNCASGWESVGNVGLDRWREIQLLMIDSRAAAIHAAGRNNPLNLALEKSEDASEKRRG
jgi:hypothetical protein